MTRWVTPELVAGVLEKCGVRDKKPGALPAGFMVYFTLALALFQQDSYDDVAEQLVGAIGVLSGSIPNKSSFTRARRRLGPLVLESVFRELASPLAPAGLEGYFYRGMRLAAVDGFVAGRAGYGGQPGRVRRPGKERAAGGLPAGAGGDADRVRHACAGRCGGGRIQRRQAGTGDWTGWLGIPRARAPAAPARP
ncbi:transposase domain-containing protein [Actinacidiphila acididurans]|uniref:transposase domain-containing protein n=1 Tax=Actinacidiphila acididurans TaxID=2784346 RepID=UPI00355897DC